MTTTTTITNMTIMTTTIIKVHMTVSKGKESEKKTLCLLGINQVGRKPVLIRITSISPIGFTPDLAPGRAVQSQRAL